MMKKSFLALLLCAALLMCCVPACAAERLSVVTTIFPEYDFVRAVTGSNADIAMLIKPGAESHSYEPSPMDIVTIRSCDVFVCVGGENDSWAQKILESVGEDSIRVIRLMDIVNALEEEMSESMQAEEEEEEETEYDEHVWTSPVNAMEIVTRIAETLAEADPEHAEEYIANAAAYNAEILQLDEEIRTIVNAGPRRELIVGDRFPFLYFVREYGLEYDAAYPGCSTEAEASAATVAALINKVQNDDIHTVLYIELSAHHLADTICEATGAKPLLLHSCHNVTKEEFDAGETYVSLMRKNLDTLREALAE